MAQVVLGQARAVPGGGSRHREAVSVALRAAALAARELGDLELAQQRLQEAVRAGAGFPRRVAQARMSLVSVRAQLGDPAGGLHLADLAERDLTGSDVARLDVQRAVALVLLGRHRDAVRHCDRAIRLLDSDPWFLAGGLLNRGVAQAYLEEHHAAAADLEECARIARDAGFDHLATLAEANLPFVAARRGDIADALARYEAAESAMSGYPERLAALRSDFAEALVAARLPGEARTLLSEAVPALVAAGARASVPSARLLLAQAELLCGDIRQARTTAQTALAELLAQGRTVWAPLATEVILRAGLASGPPDSRILADLLCCAADLGANGWTTACSALRLVSAATAVGLGHLAVARAQLDLVVAIATRPVIRQHAVAMRRRLDGDLQGALAAARDGVETLAAGWGRVRSPYGPRTDGVSNPDGAPTGRGKLWANSTRPAEDLAAFGLELALQTGDARTVLDWAERWRAIVRGRPAPVALRPGPPDGAPGRLFELVRCGERLSGVLVGGGRCLLRSLGRYPTVAEATIRVRYGLRRRNLRDSAAAADGLPAELAALDRQLFGAFLGSGDEPPGTAFGAGDEPLVVVPTGALYTLPWPLLPSLTGRSVSVAPDAIAWPTERLATGPVGGPIIAVAGPGLRYASAEADMVVATHPGAARVPATRRAVLGALEHADVLHVAAHGISVPHSPMVSQIALEDGPLMAYDILRAARAPRLVVLSACDAGLAHAPVDGATLGLAGAFLELGSTCVIAGVVPVRDDEALAVMTLFHGLLARGRSPAEALAAASARRGMAGFVCFGGPQAHHPLN